MSRCGFQTYLEIWHVHIHVAPVTEVIGLCTTRSPGLETVQPLSTAVALLFKVAREPTVRGYNVCGGRILITVSGD